MLPLSGKNQNRKQTKQLLYIWGSEVEAPRKIAEIGRRKRLILETPQVVETNTAPFPTVYAVTQQLKDFLRF